MNPTHAPLCRAAELLGDLTERVRRAVAEQLGRPARARLTALAEGQPEPTWRLVVVVERASAERTLGERHLARPLVELAENLAAALATSLERQLATTHTSAP